MAAQGRFFLDSIDIWQAYSMFIISGTDGFLQMPERKEPISHDWGDANGIDVDLSRVFFKDRDIQLQIGMIAGTQDDFLTKYTQFLGQWAKPYTHRIEIPEFNRSYYVYYKDCSAYTRYTKIDSGQAACKFTITVNEPNPTIDTSNLYIAADNGRFLIT